MMTPTNFAQTDLVLRLSGGPRDGEAIPVSTRKCFLGMESSDQTISDNPQCVIFRGSRGAVVRSYSDEILFNGEASSVHWLSQGDQIKFPNSLTVKIEQLGSINDGTETSNSKPLFTESTLSDSQMDARLDLIEAEIKDIQIRNDDTVSRFENIEVRLDGISDQMTQLVDLSTKSYAALTQQPMSPGVETQTPNVSSLVASPEAPMQIEETKPAYSQETTEEEIFASTGEMQSEETQTEAVAPAQTLESTVAEETVAEQASIETSKDESVVEYYSHADDSDEQIMTFSSESDEASDEQISNAANVEIKDAPVLVEPTESSELQNALESLKSEAGVVGEETTTDEPLTEEPSTENSTEEDAQAEAQAAQDAEAEKLARVAEMERIFGSSEMKEEEKTPEIQETFDPIPTETAAESTLEETAVSEEPSATEEPSSGLDSMYQSALAQPTQTADEQLPESFETSTHSQNEEVASSADNSLLDALSRVNNAFDSKSPEEAGLEAAGLEATGVQADAEPLEVTELAETALQNALQSEPTVEPEPTVDSEPAMDSEPTELSPLASQLLEQVKAEEAMESEQAAEPHELAGTESLPKPLPENQRVASQTIVVPPKKENESLADVLARMQEDGQWDGVPDDGEPVEPIEPVQEVQEVTPEPEVEETVSSEGTPESDVEDYMSQLLSRMRGDEPPAKAAPKAKKKVEKKPEVKKEEEVQQIVEPVNPLTPEEFKPKRKAKKIKSLDAMRELANSTAKTNIDVSEFKNKKELGYVQLGIAAAGVLMSLYYFLFSSENLLDGPFMIGATCIAASAFCLYRYYQSTVAEKQLATNSAQVAQVSESEAE